MIGVTVVFLAAVSALNGFAIMCLAAGDTYSAKIIGGFVIVLSLITVYTFEQKMGTK